MSLVKKKAFQIAVVVVAALGFSGYLFYRAHFLNNDDLLKRHYSWEQGKSYDYTIELQQKGWTAFEKAWTTSDAAPAKTIPYEIKLNIAAAKLTVLEANNKATHFALTLKDPVIEFKLADKSKEIEDSTREGLKAAVYFTLGARGGISQLKFAKESTTISRNLLRTILVESLPQLRAGRIEESFKTDARWVNQTVKEFGPLKIKKVLEGYATERLIASRKRSQLSGFFDFDLGEGQLRLKSAVGLIQARNYSGENIVQEETTELGVRFVQESAADSNWIQSLAQGKEAAISGSIQGKEEFKEAELAILRKKIEGLDFKTKLQEFFNLGEGVQIVDSYRLFDILLAFLKLHPELADIILQEMQGLTGKDGRFDIYAMLLVKSENPDLQHKLLDFAKDTWEDKDRVNQVLFNFALNKDPDQAVVERLIQMHDQTTAEDPNHSNMVMHLGSVGHETMDRSLKDAVLERVEKGLTDQTALEDKRPYVVALSNLGHPETLKYAQPYIDSKNSRERQFGAEMLRRVDGPGAEPAKETLLNLAESDSDIAVRRDASKYLDDKQYQGSQMEQIRKMLFHEKDPNVAMNLVDVLGKAEVDRAGAIQILQDYYKQCGHPEVCQKVEGLILGKNK